MFQPSPRVLLTAAFVLTLATAARGAPAAPARGAGPGPGPLALEAVLAEVDAANPSVAAGRHESAAGSPL